MTVLVVGASGYIGSIVYNKLKKENINVIGTRCNSCNEELVKFNILEDDIDKIDSDINDREKYVIICTADSSIEYCACNREKAYKKNVVATIGLIKQLNKLKYHIIFMSSDNVFDGVKGNYSEQDAANPINEYGKMKREVEQYLLQNYSNSCIARIGKVVGDYTQQKDLLNEWYYSAIQQKSIICIKGNIFNIVHINDLTKVLLLLIHNNINGLYNIVGDISYERKTMCRSFLVYMNLDAKIVEKDLNEFNFKDNRPLNISMNNTLIKSKVRCDFMSMKEIWADYKKKINVVGN